MKRIQSALSVAVVLVAAAFVPTGAVGHARAVKVQIVTVTMTEFKFRFSTKAVHPGKVSFRLVNKGKLAHDLRIAGETSAKVQPGKNGVLVVTLNKGRIRTCARCRVMRRPV